MKDKGFLILISMYLVGVFLGYSLHNSLHSSLHKSNLQVHENKWECRLADAIYRAEGGRASVVPYGILSEPCDTPEKCRMICVLSIRANQWRYLEAAGQIDDFIKFMGLRYAPPQAHPLNKLWAKNVTHLYYKNNKEE